MIQEKSGFWDSIDSTPSSEGDERTYPASDVTIPFEYLVSDGVQTGGAKLQVSPGSYDYSTQIAPGMAWVRGKWYLLYDDGTGGTAARVLLHDAPIQYSRIDRVVLRYDANYTLEGRHVYAALIKGEEAEMPIAPALTRTTEIYELSLAQVLIKPGQPAVLEADITDERFDGELCGIAGFAPQPDLQPIIDAFIARVEAYFDDIQVDIAELIAEMEAGGLPANMLSTAPPTGQPGWVNGQAYLDGLKVLVDTSANDINTLEAKDTLLTTFGTAPNFMVSDASVIEYSDGLIRLVQFHADGADITLQFGALDALSVYDSTGKPTKVKAGQTLWIRCSGTSFFVCSGGGGVSLPPIIEEGDTTIYAKVGSSVDQRAAYANVGAGWGFTAVKGGSYRVSYNLFTVPGGAGTSYARLTKNGSAVLDSEIFSSASSQPVTKTMGITLVAGDQIRLQSYNNYGSKACVSYLVAAIGADDLQDELNSCVIAL